MPYITRISALIGLLLASALLGSANVSAQSVSSLQTLGSDRQRPVPLPLNEAFPYYVSAAASGRLQVTWNPAPGHYLYRHAFGFAVQSDAGQSPSEIDFDLPDGLRKNDQFFGQVEAYYGAVTATIELPANLPAASQLWIEYQGCADWGFCYPPQRAPFILPEENSN